MRMFAAALHADRLGEASLLPHAMPQFVGEGGRAFESVTGHAEDFTAATFQPVFASVALSAAAQCYNVGQDVLDCNGHVSKREDVVFRKQLPVANTTRIFYFSNFFYTAWVLSTASPHVFSKLSSDISPL